MAIADYAQVGAIVHRLQRALERLSPATLLSTLRTVFTAVSEPPPGDPDALADLAAEFRRAGADTAAVAADASALAHGRLPAVWSGSAFASAAETAIATARLVGEVRPVFDAAAGSLTEYATTLAGLRQEHRELRARLDAAWYEATHVEVFGREVRAPDVRHLDDLVVTVRQIVAGCLDVYRRSLTASDTLIGRLGDVTARARATQVPGLPATDSVTLADAGSGLTPPTASAADRPGAAVDFGVLPPWQLLRAGRRRADLPAAQRTTFDATLDAAGSPLERAYLWKALAAGHDVSTVTAFAERIRGRSAAWLRSHLTILDPARPGKVTFAGSPFAQTDGTTCGTTSIVAARVLADPIYTLEITEDPAAFRTEQQRLHGRTNPVWPEAFGTSPWGMERGISEATGTHYDFRWADDTDPRSLSTVTRDVVTAVDAGHPVPLLVGNAYPAHYILVVGHEGDHLLIYNPAGGRLAEVTITDLQKGDLHGVTVFNHLHGLLTPPP